MHADEYNLYIRVDTNTQGHRQWYFFSVWSRRKESPSYRFNVHRFRKKDSLYVRGMRPYAFSKRELQLAIERNGGVCSDELMWDNWRQVGSKVRYWQDTSEGRKDDYVLSFDFEFKHEGDEVLFAACPPYSCSYLAKRIDGWKLATANSRFVSETMVKSVCGM